MVPGRLNGKAGLEGSSAEEIVHAGERGCGEVPGRLSKGGSRRA